MEVVEKEEHEEDEHQVDEQLEEPEVHDYDMYDIPEEIETNVGSDASSHFVDKIGFEELPGVAVEADFGGPASFYRRSAMPVVMHRLVRTSNILKPTMSTLHVNIGRIKHLPTHCNSWHLTLALASMPPGLVHWDNDLITIYDTASGVVSGMELDKKDYSLRRGNPVACSGESTCMLALFAREAEAGAQGSAHPDLNIRQELWNIFSPPTGTRIISSSGGGRKKGSSVWRVCLLELLPKPQHGFRRVGQPIVGGGVRDLLWPACSFEQKVVLSAERLQNRCARVGNDDIALTLRTRWGMKSTPSHLGRVARGGLSSSCSLGGLGVFFHYCQKSVKSERVQLVSDDDDDEDKDEDGEDDDDDGGEDGDYRGDINSGMRTMEETGRKRNRDEEGKETAGQVLVDEKEMGWATEVESCREIICPFCNFRPAGIAGVIRSLAGVRGGHGAVAGPGVTVLLSHLRNEHSHFICTPALDEQGNLHVSVIRDRSLDCPSQELATLQYDEYDGTIKINTREERKRQLGCNLPKSKLPVISKPDAPADKFLNPNLNRDGKIRSNGKWADPLDPLDMNGLRIYNMHAQQGVQNATRGQRYYNARLGTILTRKEACAGSEKMESKSSNRKLRRQKIYDQEDISVEEKEFMNLWNMFRCRTMINGSSRLGLLCAKFVEQHHRDIFNLNLRHNAVLHFLFLHERGSLTVDEFRQLVLGLDRYS